MIAAAWLFATGGTILAGIGVFFVFFRSSLLPEDLRFLERADDEIDEFMPALQGAATMIVGRCCPPPA